MPYFHSHDGTSLYYRDHGDGPAIVLLPGQGQSGRVWQHLMARLTAQGYRCVALDRRGHGRSDDPGRGFTYDSLADDVAGLLTHLDLRDVSLAGHSMGGAEAVRYLTRHGSGRVSRLVLASASLPFMKRTDDNPHGADRSVFEAVWAAWRTDWPRWVTENAPAFAGAGLPGGEPSASLVSAGIRDMDQTSLLALLQVSQSVVDTDFRPELARLDVPTLVLHGTHDASNPLDSTGRQTARLVPGAELRVYQNAPHGLVVTHLDRLAADIAGFAAVQPART